MFRSILPIAVATTLALGAGPAAAAVVVSDAGTASALLPGFKTVGARYREFESTVRQGNDREHFLGRNDLGVGANRTESDLRYVLGDNAFSLTLVNGTLTSVVNGNSRTIADIFGFSGAAADQPFDTIEFGIRDGALNAGAIALNNLLLSGTDYRGHTVSNVSLGSFGGVDNGGFRYWNATGLDFRQNFSLTGTLRLTGSFGGSAELNRVEVTLGNGPVTQPTVPEPATWALLIAGFGLVGAAARRRRPVRVLA
jgi:hypothetical protein